jgi:hypothetical protein
MCQVFVRQSQSNKSVELVVVEGALGFRSEAIATLLESVARAIRTQKSSPQRDFDMSNRLH